MTAAKPEQQDNGYLSFATLTDDNTAIMLNGESDYTVKLPKSIVKKKPDSKRKTIEDALYEGCTKYNIDQVSTDNITKIAKELVDALCERLRVNKNYVPPPSSPVIAEKYKNDYFEYLLDCQKKTIKGEDSLPRQVDYTILSAYGFDPMNLGILAPTAAGKTHVVMECKKFTPGGKEIRVVGSMTPKVLIREQGVLVDKEGNPIGKEVRKLKYAIQKAKAKKKYDEAEDYQDELAALLEDSAYIIDLSNTTLIFLESPHPELWNLIKAILSHDSYEMEHPFVDKVGTGGLEVKRVITRGWPACIFCSAKDESKWEVWPEIESRFMIVSPNMVKPKFQAGNKLIAQKKGLPIYASRN